MRALRTARVVYAVGARRSQKRGSARVAERISVGLRNRSMEVRVLSRAPRLGIPFNGRTTVLQAVYHGFDSLDLHHIVVQHDGHAPPC